MEKKKLPPRIGSEKRMRIDYGVFKIMETKDGAATVQYPDGRDPNTWFTVKPIQEKGLPPQLQWHVRFRATDGRIFDLDCYTPLSHLEDLVILREEMRELKVLPMILEISDSKRFKDMPESARLFILRDALGKHKEKRKH